jgi:O-antigen/teichoic acid export membrane protein
MGANAMPAMVKLRPNSALVRNSVWMFLGQGLRLVIQAAYFTVIARSLGASNYGAFVSVAALAGILFPFATMGSGFLLIKNVSRDQRLFSTYWGRGLVTTAAFSSIFFVIVLLLSSFVLPPTIPRRLVWLVSASDLFGLSIISMSAQAFQAFDRLNWTATINVLLSSARLAGALVLVAIHRHPTALQWGYIYFCSTAIVVLGVWLLVSMKLDSPRFGRQRSGTETREGLYFSVGLSAQTIYNDIDKAMLARLGSLDAAGIYGAAYRLIDVSFVPVSSVLAAAYPNFFRVGAAGISASLAYSKPLLLRALGYSLLVAMAMLMFSGVVPYVLGPEYARTAEALRWLALLPLLKATHYFLSDALSGAGFQAVRSCIQAGVAGFNVILNLWLIPAYSWRGAAWSSIASDALLASAIGMAAFLLSRRSGTGSLHVATNGEVWSAETPLESLLAPSPTDTENC